jgi:hypothetical protein
LRRREKLVPVANEKHEDRGRTAGDLRIAADFVLGHIPATLTVLGLFAYAVAKATADGFYGALSVVPEEVGVTYASVLSRASLYLAIIALVVIASGAVIERGKIHTRRSALGAAVGVSFLAFSSLPSSLVSSCSTSGWLYG